MQIKEKVLILFSNYGEGHQQAARAIADAAQLYPEGVETCLIDVMEWAYPFFNSISRSIFIQGVKSFPTLYGRLYEKSRDEHSFFLNQILHLGMMRIRKLIEKIEPSVVVSTFPIASGIMSMLKINRFTDIPTVTVITDYSTHSYWVHPHTDLYVVGSEGVRKQLHAYAIPDSLIKVTGIPVRSKFCHTYDTSQLAAKYKLDPNKPVVLVMGGGYGIIDDGLLKALEAVKQKFQLIIVCGHNRRLRKHLEKQVNNFHHPTVVTGYIDFVHELMALADVMITKPGGITISEGIALQLPMLLYKPLPGQEQENAKFLTQSQVAMQASSMSEVSSALSSLLTSPMMRERLKANAKKLHNTTASSRTLDAILAICKKKSLSLSNT
ncbi:glycosyltransferase [Aneurinibacillus sp. Ricciae_BoGa-3]|uniref:MGDG synthase family glycosyltransferase n=1 Tax=Aneurinibacillus sp. Ricciae_BoGa-3 TaxID=3022697 RepID=UPI0023425943|nr:glycosyltransferase [Aneurinibacillus sp. Ricciae_BoGa-3]WCK53400.1 glycosyltransferase [Aneurinibacillus sp. Ricciae_BoGa-3]